MSLLWNETERKETEREIKIDVDAQSWFRKDGRVDKKKTPFKGGGMES